MKIQHKGARANTQPYQSFLKETASAVIAEIFHHVGLSFVWDAIGDELQND